MDIVIEINQVSFAYPAGAEVFGGLSLNLAKGQRLGLIGANGAGKSTLLSLLVGLLHPSSGGIRICGEPMTAKSARKLRSKIGVVFQNPDEQLFCTTVYEDVAFGPRHMGLPENDVQTRTAAALETMEIAHLAGRAPYRLSDGEKRRAAIATVLSMTPEILLLDEPTATLDPKSRRNLLCALQNLPQSMIIATHDLDFVRRLCPQTAILSGGAVAAFGDSGGLLDDTALLEQCGL